MIETSENYIKLILDNNVLEKYNTYYFFKHPKDVSIILKKMEELTSSTDPIRLMEICGTHTMAIARSGIKSILPQSIQLI